MEIINICHKCSRLQSRRKFRYIVFSRQKRRHRRK